MRGILGSLLSRDTTFCLTPLGKDKAEQFEGDGALYEIVVHLSERGPSTVGEIAENCRMTTQKAKHLCRIGRKRGLIKKMRGERDEEDSGE
ncbi:hypothetical protein LCGC14_0744880 [marine sediment metagenome]|uniref:HTH marR-type domain-containing protein n=1 Tax=marine sediment metagenome TaxID=412755 RepID=A0A0F9Q5Q7_9ZZZZ